MAGGKETPRQKLIGLMYLVLLALLALQVSSSIMEKFKFIDDSLQLANEAADKNNTKVEKGIEKLVTDNGSKPKDAQLLQSAKEVRAEAAKIKAKIEELRNKLVEVTEGYEEGHGGKMWKGAKEETKVEILMIGAEGSKNGEGYKLQKEINDYCDKMTSILAKTEAKRSFEHIAKNGEEDERIVDHESKKKDFANLNFAQTPMCAAMAILSNIESEVLKHETDALAAIQSLLGADEIKFDKITASYSATSGIVAAGTKYQADLFILASSSTLKPIMKMSGRDIPVKDGIGKIELTATADGGSTTPDGLIKKGWDGSITIKNKGKDTTFKVKGEYYVVKPVIQVQAGALAALYEGCANYLSIQVPALGANYSPSFSAENGSVAKGNNAADKGSIAVTPNDGTAKKSKVKIKVVSGGSPIGSTDFEVRKVPLPTIKIKINGAVWDGKTPIKASASNIGLTFVADESFAGAVGPVQSKFAPNSWVVMLAKGKRAVQTNDAGTAGSFTVADPGKGDRIVLEVKKITRAGTKTIEMTGNNIFIIPVDNGK